MSLFGCNGQHARRKLMFLWRHGLFFCHMGTSHFKVFFSSIGETQCRWNRGAVSCNALWSVSQHRHCLKKSYSCSPSSFIPTRTDAKIYMRTHLRLVLEAFPLNSHFSLFRLVPNLLNVVCRWNLTCLMAQFWRSCTLFTSGLSTVSGRAMANISGQPLWSLFWFCLKLHQCILLSAKLAESSLSAVLLFNHSETVVTWNV